MAICIFAELEVHQGRMEEFKTFATEAAAMVKRNSGGDGPSLYDFYSTGPDSRQIFVAEIYPDIKAITQHIENMKEYADGKKARGEELSKVWDVKRLAVSGEGIPDHVIEHLKANAGEAFDCFSAPVSSAFGGSKTS